MKICSHIFLENPNYISSKRACRALHCLRNLKGLHNGWMWFFKFSTFHYLSFCIYCIIPKFPFSSIVQCFIHYATFFQLFINHIYILHIIRIHGLSKGSIWLNYLCWLKGMSILIRIMKHERHMVFFCYSFWLKWFFVPNVMLYI